jgi:hypothetical protein
MAGVKASIADMRPTQLTLGLSEVEERAAKIAAMTPADREAHLERKPVPHVLGPGKKIYIVDHHHLARALWSLKIPEAVLGERVADWSGLEAKAFWRMMESKGYCWPIDGVQRPLRRIVFQPVWSKCRCVQKTWVMSSKRKPAARKLSSQGCLGKS